MAPILLIEPFYGGSHKQLLDTLLEGLSGLMETVDGQPCYQLHTLPDKKWHWRARTSALHFAETIPIDQTRDTKVLLSSSVLNLAELVALRPDLRTAKKVLYFHENQLVYPVQKHQERDFQYGYNQILSCLVADIVAFNSAFNMESFLSSIGSFFKQQPDHRPKNLAAKLAPKCRVLYFPIHPMVPANVREAPDDSTALHIVWPHRWEHDKGPETFFRAMESLAMDSGCRFQLSVLGQQFTEVPAVFEEARRRLEGAGPAVRIVDWGYVSRQRFIETLSKAHVVVSTALHEFFGVSMIEAALLGCYPLCPNRLSYPEIFPKECLYNTEAQLIKKLRSFCRRPALAASSRPTLDLDRFLWPSLKEEYTRLLFA